MLRTVVILGILGAQTGSFGKFMHKLVISSFWPVHNYRFYPAFLNSFCKLLTTPLSRVVKLFITNLYPLSTVITKTTTNF